MKALERSLAESDLSCLGRLCPSKEDSEGRVGMRKSSVLLFLSNRRLPLVFISYFGSLSLLDIFPLVLILPLQEGNI